MVSSAFATKSSFSWCTTMFAPTATAATITSTDSVSVGTSSFARSVLSLMDGSELVDLYRLAATHDSKEDILRALVAGRREAHLQAAEVDVQPFQRADEAGTRRIGAALLQCLDHDGRIDISLQRRVVDRTSLHVPQELLDDRGTAVRRRHHLRDVHAVAV